MSYVRNVLQPGENLLIEGRPHWIAYWRTIACLLLAAGVLSFVPSVREETKTILQICAGALALLGLGFAVVAWLLRWGTEIGVTDRRVIYKRGIVSRQTAEMNMDKIETVEVRQSLLGRMLGYGTITIQGTGAGIESLRRIADPIGLRNAITAR